MASNVEKRTALAFPVFSMEGNTTKAMFHLSFTDNHSEHQLFGSKNHFSCEGWNEGFIF
jgi:hypothetical protein